MFHENWIQVWKNKSYRLQFVFTLVLLFLIAVSINSFFKFIQYRQAVALEDKLLDLIEPIDLSLFTFIFIYTAIVWSLIILSAYPVLLLKGIQAYCILTLFRMLCIYLLPLETPEGIIILRDPFVAYFFYADTQITKDLFFSGHVSTLFLLWLLNPKKKLRFLFLGITLLVAFFILLQHVHYTVDILLAPVFAWISYRLAMLIPLKL